MNSRGSSSISPAWTPHGDLLEAGGLYAHLWGVQAGEIDELPREFIERAAERQARTEAEMDDD